MLYMGRGNFSSVGGGLGGGLESNDNNRNNGRIYCRGGFFRIHYFIPLDNT